MSRTDPALRRRVSATPLTLAVMLTLLFADGPLRAAEADNRSAVATPWRAGLARAVITPAEPVWLAGYGSRREPDGKLHDLWAKVLVLEDPHGQRGVLITSDFQGVPKSMSDRVFQRLEDRFALTRAEVMLTFSHNHCGPRLGDDLVDYYPIDQQQVERVARYTQQMEDKLVELVGQALADLAPASLAMGQGMTGFAVNRRNNAEADVPGLLADGIPLRGPVDHAVPVLTVTRSDGELAAILFGYACHPTTLSFTKWCGDYPGFAQLAIEKSFPSAMAMFVNTCGGDQNPLPRRTVELCEKYGEALAEAVRKTLAGPLQPISARLRCRFESVDLAYQQVITREQLNELVDDRNAIRARWASRMLAKLDAGETFAAEYPYPLHAWRLGGELLIIGMGAETVVDYSLRFKREYGAGTWVFGYVDDMIAYIPSRRVWEEGGYEGGSNLYEYGRPALRWQGDVEQRIADVVDRLVTQVSDIDYQDAIARLDSAIRYEVQDKQLPAFSIAVIAKDGVAWSAGFGFEDQAQTRPATDETVYRVGSISKLFTDIAVMRAVERGELDLDAPVQRYLPQFQPTNPYGVPLTLRQMMSHQSGLVRESPVGNYFDPTEPTLDETLASLNQTTLVYRPQTRTKYSNAAVSVVGAALESVSGRSHPELIRSEILEPLGMSASDFVVTPAVEAHLATGQMWTYDGRRFAAPDFLLGTGPAGNLYSSVLDLSRFVVCLLNDTQTDRGPLLKPESHREMTQPVTTADGQPQTFGLGYRVDSFDGHVRWGHGGAVYGFSTQLEVLPQRDLGVVAAASLDGSNGVVSRLAEYALRLWIATEAGRPLPEYRRTEPLEPTRARGLVGRFRQQESDRIAEITAAGDEVFLKQGVFRQRLRASADNGAVITDDPIGFGREVRLDGSDAVLIADTRYQRLPDEPPAAAPTEWRGLIGEYGWDHNTLYIREHGGQLHALIEWFYDYPLRSLGDDEFAFPDYGLYHGERLRFKRDASGTATAVVAAEVEFARRPVGLRDGETFRITPVRPIDELRALAESATPPVEEGEFRDPDRVEPNRLEPGIRLDIRYATTDNFTGAVFYDQPRAFLQRPAAEAVARVHRGLRPYGLGLLIHDAYRPWYVTKMFWEATPADMKDFVANPAAGSRHNRGCAVDLTLYDLQTGDPIEMVAGYDEFSARSSPLYPGGTSRQRWYRDLLRRAMEREDFTVYEYEWWHFDFRDWQRYPIGNASFEEISEADPR